MNKGILIIWTLLLSATIYSCTSSPNEFDTCSSCIYIPNESADSITKRLSKAIDDVYYDYNSPNGDTILMKGSIYKKLGVVNDSSLIHFFNNWNRSIKPHTHKGFEEEDILKNICKVYINMHLEYEGDTEYILIQPTIKYDVVDSYFIDLYDCVDQETSLPRKMKTLIDFRPHLSSTKKHRVLYSTDAYRQAFDTLLNTPLRNKAGFHENKKQHLNKYINTESSELDFLSYISSSYYVGYIVFNKTMNTAIISESYYSVQGETWLIKKMRNGRWKKEKQLGEWVI